MTVETTTQTERQEEDEFLDKVLDTAVMKAAMTYLQQKGNIQPLLSATFFYNLKINFHLKAL